MVAVLGIDLGTQSVTALAADLETGRPLGLASSPLGLHVRAGGVREQEPEWWWDATLKAVRSFDGLIDVQAVTVAGQQHGLVCLDKAGSALGPASLWNDTSSAEWASDLTSRLGGREAVRALVGMDLGPGYTAPKLARLRSIDRPRFLASACFCLPHDYLTARLVGQPVTDAGDASSTGYFDVRGRRWCDEVLEAIDPKGRLAERLPAVAPPGVAVGALKSEPARALKLREGIAVCNGTGDNMATAVGMGLFAAGRIGVSLGTSATAFAYSSGPACDPLGEAAAFCDATGGWLPLVCTLNCTRVLHGTAEMLGTDLAGLEDAASKVAPGAGGLSFFPYVDGERTPPLSEGSGVLWGIGPSNLSAAHLARAAYDGVVLSLAHGLVALERAGVSALSVAVGGGGAGSALLRQTLSDVTGYTVRKVPSDEPCAWGAAALAAWALTGEKVEEIMRRWWRGAGPGAVSVTEPEMPAHHTYLAELVRRGELMTRFYT